MKNTSKKWNYLLAAGILSVQTLLPCGHALAQEGENLTKVYFLDVGDGLSVLVESEQSTLLFDGGGADYAEETAEFLKKRGISKIDFMIASCTDPVHVEGLSRCLEECEVGIVLTSRFSENTQEYQAFLDLVNRAGIMISYPIAGEVFRLGQSQFTILTSGTEEMSIRVERGGSSILIAGDIGPEVQKELLGSGLNIDSDVLCMPMHGADGTDDSALISAVSPLCAVVSCEENSTAGYPSMEALKTLEEQQIDLYRIDEQGTVAAISNGNEIKWTQSPCNDYMGRMPVPDEPSVPTVLPASAIVPAPSTASAAAVPETEAAAAPAAGLTTVYPEGGAPQNGESVLQTVEPQTGGQIFEEVDSSTGSQTTGVVAASPAQEQISNGQNAAAQMPADGTYTVTTVTTTYTTYTTYYY